MDPFQAVAGFFFMIKGKVFAQFIPPFRDMTNTTVPGKICMRNQGAPFFIPFLLRHKKLAARLNQSDHSNEP